MSQFELRIFRCLLSEINLNLYILQENFREFIFIITLLPIAVSFWIA